MKENKFFWADLSISILDIKAESKDQAEKIVNEFLDKIAPIMQDSIRWDGADWEIKESHFSDSGEWIDV